MHEFIINVVAREDLPREVLEVVTKHETSTGELVRAKHTEVENPAGEYESDWWELIFLWFGGVEIVELQANTTDGDKKYRETSMIVTDDALRVSLSAWKGGKVVA